MKEYLYAFASCVCVWDVMESCMDSMTAKQFLTLHGLFLINYPFLCFHYKTNLAEIFD